MSYYGAPPPPLGTPPEEPLSRIPGWVMSVAGLVVVAMVATFVFVLLHPTHVKASAAPPSQPDGSYPAHWDKRIAPFAKIASKERGLRFLHPVPVRFLSPKKFAQTMRTEDDELSKKDRAHLVQSAAQLRAVGLIGGGVDLLDATNDFSSGAVVGYYSYKTQRITIRGHRITPDVKETLVHELTHVLQDQHFHIGARLKRLDRDSGEGTDDSAASVYRAIVEGDAVRIQHKYDASLGPRDRRALAAANRTAVAGAQDRVSSVPPAIRALEDAPYALGEPLVTLVARDLGGWAVNRMFRHPPTHDSVMLDPFRFVSHSAAPVTVAVPKLGHGEKKEQAGEFGALTLYLMLAQRLPMSQALAAADAWGGDAMVTYRRGGTTCLRADFAGRTPAGTSAIESALQQWRSDGSTATADVTRLGGRVRLDTCDPGGATYLGSNDAEESLKLPTIRSDYLVVLLRSGYDPTQSRCIVGHMASEFTVSELTDDAFAALESTGTRMRAFAAECV